MGKAEQATYIARGNQAYLLVNIGHGHGEVQEDLGGGQDHRAVGVLQPVLQQVHDVEDLLLGKGKIEHQGNPPPMEKEGLTRTRRRVSGIFYLRGLADGIAGLCSPRGLSIGTGAWKTTSCAVATRRLLDVQRAQQYFG
jgi:hypothetical protein